MISVKKKKKEKTILSATEKSVMKAMMRICAWHFRLF
jgi:hypothetical protein